MTGACERDNVGKVIVKGEEQKTLSCPHLLVSCDPERNLEINII